MWPRASLFILVVHKHLLQCPLTSLGLKSFKLLRVSRVGPYVLILPGIFQPQFFMFSPQSFLLLPHFSDIKMSLANL